MSSLPLPPIKDKPPLANLENMGACFESTFLLLLLRALEAIDKNTKQPKAGENPSSLTLYFSVYSSNKFKVAIGSI
jgi:hypothetical protein